MAAPTRTPSDPISALLDSFTLSLQARRRSPRTIRSYTGTAALFADFCRSAGRPVDPAQVKPGDVEAFIVDQLARTSASTAASRFRYLQQWFRWLIEEGILDEPGPMHRLHAPALDETVVPILDDDEMRALIAACETGPARHRRFEDHRDGALLRFFIDTGTRLGEVVALAVESIATRDAAAVVTGKGRRQRRVFYSSSTAVALDRYLRHRAQHPHAATPALWLGARGPLTETGITRIVKRRAEAAGLTGVHPHMFRHSFAHQMKAGGMPDDEVMALAGWRSPQMLARYGASARVDRARDTYRRLAPGDRL